MKYFRIFGNDSERAFLLERVFVLMYDFNAVLLHDSLLAILHGLVICT